MSTTTTRPAKPAIKMEQMYVTPAMAKAWLDKSAPNRTISNNRVAALASDITAGRFLPTHQGIAFNTAGELCDGQHRLSAIVAADYGVWLFVASNLPVDTMGVLDSGRTRTLADRVTIGERWERSTTIMAMARILVCQELDRPSGHGVSDQLIVQMAKREYEHLAWIAALPNSPKFTAYGPVGAAIAYVRPTLPKVMTNEFAENLRTGANLTSGSPVLALRHHLEKSRSKGSISERAADFRRTLNALRAYAVGDARQIIRDDPNGAEWVTRMRKEKGLPTTLI
jgi:hypothetical protein